MTSYKLIHWLLRLAVLMEFVGHGAFGIIGKQGWLPYFQVFGIPEAWAWRLMPLVGSVDILLGISCFFYPRRILFLYMGFWGFFTATLRPFSGEPVWEFVERSYNMAVPILFLILHQTRWSWKTAFEVVPAPSKSDSLDAATAKRLFIAARVICASMLLGHGLLAALVQKKSLILHLNSTGWPQQLGIDAANLAIYQGWLEILLGITVLLFANHSVFMLIFVWKIVTEGFFFSAHAPGASWEWIERGGSYIAPWVGFISLLVLLEKRSSQIIPKTKHQIASFNSLIHSSGDRQ